MTVWLLDHGRADRDHQLRTHLQVDIWILPVLELPDAKVSRISDDEWAGSQGKR